VSTAQQLRLQYAGIRPRLCASIIAHFAVRATWRSSLVSRPTFCAACDHIFPEYLPKPEKNISRDVDSTGPLATIFDGVN
jgi:hypothetical protein